MSIEKTETRLMNKAVHYLGRYSASEQRLREVLSRFATRKLADIEPAEMTRRLRQHSTPRTPIIKMPNWRQPSILPDAAGWDPFSREWLTKERVTGIWDRSHGQGFP